MQAKLATRRSTRSGSRYYVPWYVVVDTDRYQKVDLYIFTFRGFLLQNHPLVDLPTVPVGSKFADCFALPVAL